MSNRFIAKKKQLKKYFDVDFPDLLFWLGDFLENYPQTELNEDLAALGIFPSGVLQLLLENNLESLSWKADPILHWRFYCDLPEFFSYLHGDTDGLHWGLLIDDPDKGFCGVASYYRNEPMQVYDNVFDALKKRCQSIIENYNELLEDDPDNNVDYLEQRSKVSRFIHKLEKYIHENSINITKKRIKHIPCNTGLGLFLSNHYHKLLDLHRTLFFDVPYEITNKDYEYLLTNNEEDDLINTFQVGRSLWYWGGEKYSERAYRLLRRAYEKLNRDRLINILDLHFKNRNINNVDMLAND